MGARGGEIGGDVQGNQEFVFDEQSEPISCLDWTYQPCYGTSQNLPFRGMFPRSNAARYAFTAGRNRLRKGGVLQTGT